MDPALIALLLSTPAFAIYGLCIGSFLNVVIHRLPQMLERQWRAESAEILEIETPAPAAPLDLWRPRSRCPACGHMLAWWENLPIVSWLALRGRCSACRAAIPVRYPVVELATAGLFAVVSWRIGATTQALLWCGFVAVLLAAALIDWDTTLLPDQLTQPLLWAGLIAAALGWGRLTLADALWGAVAGYLSLWAVTWFFKLATGKIGMGAGDFKLLAAMGAWLGATLLLPLVLAASMLGAVVGIGMKLTGALREGRYVPFGPFLAGAGVAVLLLGNDRVLGWLGWY